MNVVLLTGNLGRDPEVTTNGDGTSRCKLRLAVDRTYMSGGKQKTTTDWVDVVVWGKQAEVCSKYLRKGRLVQIQGELRSRSYEHQGQKRAVTEVVADKVDFLDKPAKGTQPEALLEQAQEPAVEQESSSVTKVTRSGVPRGDIKGLLEELFTAFNMA